MYFCKSILRIRFRYPTCLPFVKNWLEGLKCGPTPYLRIIPYLGGNMPPIIENGLLHYNYLSTMVSHCTTVSQYHGELISKWEKKGWRSCMWVWGKQLEEHVGPMVHSCTIIELSCKGLAHGEAGSLIYESTNLDSAALIHTRTALFTFELQVCWTFCLSQKCTEKFTLKLKSAITSIS